MMFRLPPTQTLVRWTFIGFAGLAVLASVVAGGERHDAVTEDAGQPRSAPTEELKIAARSKEDPSAPGSNPELFAPRDWRPASPPARAARPAAPTAPPLPFRYVGRMLDDGRTSIFVARGEQTFSVAPGQHVDPEYRLEKATAAELVFTYLPLNTRQILPIPLNQ